jgi:hypothetical protein
MWLVVYVCLSALCALWPSWVSTLPPYVHPVVLALAGPPAWLTGSSLSGFLYSSAAVAVPAGIAWAIWRYDPAPGVGIFWTVVAVLAWLISGLLSWATLGVRS